MIDSYRIYQKKYKVTNKKSKKAAEIQHFVSERKYSETLRGLFLEVTCVMSGKVKKRIDEKEFRSLGYVS